MMEEKVDPAEVRVQGLRDALVRVADELDAPGTIVVGDLLARVRGAWEGVAEGDLGPDEAMIAAQFEAMFGRLGELAASHPGPVPTSALGLPADARFLRDMATFLTRRYGLVDA
jgi:hypothetical protein